MTDEEWLKEWTLTEARAQAAHQTRGPAVLALCSLIGFAIAQVREWLDRVEELIVRLERGRLPLERDGASMD